MAASDKFAHDLINIPLSQRIVPYAVVTAAACAATYILFCAVDPFGIRPTQRKGKEN